MKTVKQIFEYEGRYRIAVLRMAQKRARTVKKGKRVNMSAIARQAIEFLWPTYFPDEPFQKAK